MNGEDDLEFDMAVKAAWWTYHSKAPLWRARDRWVDKVSALHMAVFPSLVWCSGARPWSFAELEKVNTLRRMTRRVANW